MGVSVCLYGITNDDKMTFIQTYISLWSGEVVQAIIGFDFSYVAIELRVRPVDWDLDLTISESMDLDLNSDLQKEDLDLPLGDLTILNSIILYQVQW